MRKLTRYQRATNFLMAPLISIFFIAICYTGALAAWRPDINFEYLGQYESNVYHAHLDSLKVDDQLNEIDLEAQWQYLSSLRLEHQFTLYSGFDIYARNSVRDRNKVGAEYEPRFRYARRGYLKLRIDFSRGKKDLIDDNGELLARTLAKNVLRGKLYNFYRYRHFKTMQSIEFANYNYDESYDQFGKRITSYDYNSSELAFELEFELNDYVNLVLGTSTEKRNYDERKTLSLDKRSSRVRNYRVNSVAFGLEFTPVRHVELVIDAKYNHRKENYQNFYGYDYRRYEIKLDMRPVHGHRAEISFSYRDKDYPNYYTTNIGLLNRVSIEYAVLDLEYTIRLTRHISMLAGFRNFNKVSVDPNFDYNDVTGGIGFVIKL